MAEPGNPLKMLKKIRVGGGGGGGGGGGIYDLVG